MLIVVIAEIDRGAGGSDKDAMDRFGLMLGVTSGSAEGIMQLVSDHVHKTFAARVTSVFESRPPDWKGRDADLSEEIIGDPTEEGIWYSSSRAWFAEGEEDIPRELI